MKSHFTSFRRFLSLTLLLPFLLASCDRSSPETSGDSRPEEKPSKVIEPIQADDNSPTEKPSPLPIAAREEKIGVYLATMQKLNHDFSVPIESIHRFRCSNQEAAQQVEKWGIVNGFYSKGIREARMHFGDPTYFIALAQKRTISANNIQSEVQLISTSVPQMEGVQYTDWLTGKLAN